MKQFKLFSILVTVLLFASAIQAQNRPTQTIRGTVVDHSSGTPLPYIHVILTDLPEIGASTDNDGKFVLSNVPVGRHDLRAGAIGYETSMFREIMVTSAKEVNLEIRLKESTQQLEEVTVTVRTNKDQPLNNMALSGARMLSVEEASRFAGGMDDPARLVSSFAGVSPGVGNNGISVHGNAPSLLQWRLEDVEIPNPNHFADVATLGGGILSSLSSNVLGNSDFFTSAFPAEYNNAVSGVFDMRLRNGNSQKFQHTLQAGILGLDIASEGPISKKHNSSYIFNYRYSTTGLMNKVSPAGDLEQVMDYQDLNFKLNFPTRKAGVFSVWGTALKDKIKPEIESPEEWEFKDDAKDSRMNQTSAAAGLSHRYFFNENTSLKTTVATTYSEAKAWEKIYNQEMISTPWLDFNSKYTNLVLTSHLNKKYSNKHTNKTGFTVTNMRYDTHLKLAPFETKPLETVSEGKGNTNLISAYTSSLFNFNDQLSATIGVNGQILTLNNRWTVEPRAAIKWQASSRSSFGLAYGLHSRMEKMDVYFVKTKESGDKLVNKDLDFTKTHHLSLSYNYKLSDNMNLKVETYLQYLYDVPVMADSSYSILNRNLFYVENELVNKGKGRNYGVDVTLEKYMTKGMYYMLTASLFNSEYCGGDGVWHNTKFNRNYIINGLVGKEWMMGRNKQNVLSVNLKLTLQGGERYSLVDVAASMAHPDKETQYDETRAYSQQMSPMFLANYTVSYRMNRKKVSHEFAVKGMNATGYKEYFGHEHNFQTGSIEPKRIKNSIFNVVYRLDF
ncbi:carboxypeptidase-like regulatory domain-containing protein [Bacteroides sp. 224]|uniref:TonB-dependent receptor n=1 Tax=Bacteroides sp. 224 TaxID=2302936 RepID=UPI0013CFFE87|nr:carboxypeptidase-like regulatory domain-containing protein [Bacteroides sp. 224]NDV66313.1 carboxypeptidase-like regulatory domain-containing protein [Bacteroides sp. 224]